MAFKGEDDPTSIPGNWSFLGKYYVLQVPNSQLLLLSDCHYLLIDILSLFDQSS